MFAKQEPDHRKIKVFTVVGSSANKSICLFFVKTIFCGGEISARHKDSHL